MLGEAFREEVAANGGRMPSFSLATIADVASRVWLKARAWRGGKQAHQPQVHTAQLHFFMTMLQAAWAMAYGRTSRLPLLEAPFTIAEKRFFCSFLASCTV